MVRIFPGLKMKSAANIGGSLALFVCWLLLGQISYYPDDVLASVALIWLPTGAALAIVSIVQPQRAPWLIAASGVAAFCYALGADMPLKTAVIEGLGELLAVTAGASLLRASRGWSDPRLRWLGLATACGVSAAIASTGFVVGWMASDQDLSWGTAWVMSAVGEWVGALLITPLVLSFAAFRPKRSGGMPMLKFGGGGLAFAGFLVVATLIFQGDVNDRFGHSLGPTLTYLPLALLIVTSLVWGERGAALAVAIGAALMIGWTALGKGPFAANENFPGEALLEVQAFIVVIALLTGLMLALQDHTARALDTARRWQLRYLNVLETGGFATLSIDARNGHCDWSENAAALLGRPPDAHVTALIERADPADQPIMHSQWHMLRDTGQSEVKWFWPDGTHATLTAVAGPDGRIELVTGLLSRTRQR